MPNYPSLMSNCTCLMSNCTTLKSICTTFTSNCSCMISNCPVLTSNCCGLMTNVSNSYQTAYLLIMDVSFSQRNVFQSPPKDVPFPIQEPIHSNLPVSIGPPRFFPNILHFPNPKFLEFTTWPFSLAPTTVPIATMTGCYFDINIPR